MQSLCLPESICDYIDKRIRSCIWAKGGHSRGWNLVSWREASCSKMDGGLGVHTTRLNNVALLGDYNQGESYIWKSIIRAKNNIVHGFGALLGNGESSFWYDN
ncbi:unnamed protein product [Cuscuta europaea]|uniref:Uncharacterized protein n=1 Tax=Cuscuta europaea TaxID=41803 RepID=A0A9P0YTX3_CUSEU|nr:unnamed protein product [Cuscuta europaea]